MRSLSRRRFLAQGAAGLAAAGYLAGAASESNADPIGLPIGLQLYTVRDALQKDFDGTLKQVAAAGYQEVELYSFFDKSPAGVRRSLEGAGLRCVSAHFPAAALSSNTAALVSYAHDLGLQFMVCPFPGSDPNRPRPQAKKGRPAPDFSLDDWKWNAELFNKAGEAAKKAGIQFAYHNHHLEFKSYDGKTAFEVLLTQTEPGLVKLEVDCGWVTVAGHDPAVFINHHADRVVLLHIKDIKKGFTPTTNFGPVPFTEVGHGVVDWPHVFEAARQAGVKRYYVEQDTTERPPLEAIKLSYDYLHGLKVG